MLIDWFTVFAQIVNFLVLLALLRRFLYGPIVKAMDERQARLAAQAEEAEAARKRAEEEAESYRHRREELDDQRDELFAAAKREAEDRRADLTATARAEVDEVRERWLRAIQQDKESFLDDLRRRTGDGVVEVARRALADLATADLERQIMEVFIQRLQQMKPDEREVVAGAVRGSENGLVVQSAFPVPEDFRQRIIKEVTARFPDAAAVRFERATDLISGIELRAQSGKIGWSVADYLETLQSSLTQALADEAWEQERKAVSEG